MENPYKKSDSTLVEYALILAIICIVIASLMLSFEERTRSLDTKLSSTLDSAVVRP